LTAALVIVGAFQVIIMNKQKEIMKWQLNNLIPEGKAKPVF
jgi:hypothetical protein